MVPSIYHTRYYTTLLGQHYTRFLVTKTLTSPSVLTKQCGVVSGVVGVVGSSVLSMATLAGALSIKLYVVLARCLWLENLLFSLCILNHKHLTSRT